MKWNVNENDTLYAIFLTLPKTETITIGALGTFTFEKGDYVYIGSAKKNIVSRVERHAKIEKPKRWHLDYFRPYCEVTAVQSFPEGNGECALAASFAEKGTIPINKFGASDCRCRGHLVFIK
ncbi:GIY-YIG nuclease family protein [Bacillus sp. AGMB 02131]|uniref:GIY-YIG nuclease family protein n=1 Tax=Peribacillus faecalis TaxID=2772559 RepID=A0A927CZB8_9BACI|nr:GIY-YIG nuclease family protein [Peribacillus faecalis]MBD3109864.1 GIY-YIG nuclease family protein [Peribacillus faecalis]